MSEGKYGGSKKDVFNFREKGEVVVHGDFNIAIVLDEEYRGNQAIP